MGKAARLLAAVVSWEPLAQWIPARRAHTGRPPCDRLRLATAFFAKAVYHLSTTLERLQSDEQLRRLCGWNSAAAVPTEAAFWRAFAEFAQSGLPSQIHEALVRRSLEGRELAYVARDSTALEAREHLPEDYREKQRRQQAAYRRAESEEGSLPEVCGPAPRR